AGGGLGPGGCDVTGPWLRHRCFLRFLLRLEVRGGYALFTISGKLIRMLPHGHSAINRARALLTARFSPVKPLRPAARASSRPSIAGRRSAGPPRTGEGFLTIVTQLETTRLLRRRQP